ncbi:MAG: type IV secretory system conjugative DNA transfer family protein [Lachnospiraceae bacterium]|nr:type IV secretory system conjugative DNA transfer family protein [Lachnospiraceae bacterium]
MKKKEKLIFSALMMGVGTIANLFFTASLHEFFSKQYGSMGFVSFSQCVNGLATGGRQFYLFLVFEGLLALGLILFWIRNSCPYQSELVQIAGEIYTPAPVGQYQHGSSRWLKKQECDRVFETQVIDPHNHIVKRLLDSGGDDLEFLEQTVDAIEQERTCHNDLSEQRNIVKEREEENFESVEYQIFAASGANLASHKGDTILQEYEQPRRLSGQSEGVEKDRYKLFSKGGIVVGMEKIGNREKLYMVGGDTHTLTIGATRSGKTRCLVIQSISAIGLAGESMVISDPKAELYHYTARLLEKLGYEVICLDFKSPEKSSRYNLLQPVINAVAEGDMERAEMYAWDITNILVGSNTSNEKIWENGEKSTIAAAILCVVVDNKKRPEYQNLTNVYWFIAEMSKAVGGKTPMGEYMKKLPAKHPARALLSIAEVAPSRTKGSFDTSALTTLRLFTSRSVYAITHKSDYDIAEIGRKKQALFLILPDEKTTYYPIASLMVSQLYELLVHQSDMRGGRLERRVNFILDEFGNFTKLDDFTNKLTVAGGRGVRFNLFLQSFEQLVQKYDKETAAVVKSNCQTWIYLQADDKETLQDICDKLGKYTTSAYQLSGQHGRYVNPSSSHSISLVARELLTTDEIRRISRPYQIVISRAHPAMMNAPDLSQWYFNRMCGLGDMEHNRRVREAREKARKVLSPRTAEIPLWNIWVYYTKDLQLKEAQQKSQAFVGQADAIFPSVKNYQQTGGAVKIEEDDET